MGGALMYVLAIDTSTDAVVTGVARVDDAGTGVLAERAVSDGRRHAEVLTTLIAEVLTESAVARGDLDAVVLGCGPGPFTGLRVGMATAASFADALALPVYGVCSLDAVAACAADDIAGGSVPRSVLVVTDARRREIYWARYVDGERVSGPSVTAPAEVVADLAAVDIDLVVGSPEHARLFDRPVGRATAPSTAGLVGSAITDLRSVATPAPLVPLYLRRPDAVEPTAKRRRAAAGGVGR
ncbi:tRNA (adenosine(37)-N6)-threonylcarbamoyltransferase complex dimerization subunit type 1 TsaB [Gordonia sp. ABSL11-1]|uniref:tRNA (adenosine(37)-N6)-threonylcarbamoyltransferase complex dimerization subunit type 1 TsaB n=1 Tax=Gordonia sp. ABSL11-1 TaxID=3053924 RepID=UPI00257295D6|nr:tRNA (adenosine(37)-N6)-threonylcarbamoyltransferase complex dimerization subunit type 1 TsaB [Gordonia sp. ABSL11-1]MDL9948188.1 tRNA (adenosine(37)-N6)-threonylcarbamoyltransferase complex dimerization subunit type 1 TsaB [Gordonia sp. ABSL11-1]